MKYFVTGGSGFLGRHLLRELREAGHDVTALARSDASAARVEELGAESVRGDLNDRSALEQGMSGCDIVVHAAALTDQWGPWERFQAVNVDGTAAVMTAARAARVPRVVHVSSEAALADGRPLVNVDETRPLPAKNVGHYPRSKKLAEEVARAANGPDLEVVVVRPRFVWGPEDETVLPVIVDTVERGRYAWIDGGTYLTSTCHVRNVCEGIVAAAERGRPGEVYFLTDGEPVTLREFLTDLAATRGVTLPDRDIPRRVAWLAASALEAFWRVARRPGEPPITKTFLALGAHEMTVNDAKARRELGYTGRVERDAGMAELAAE